MNTNNILNQQIRTYLLDNPDKIDRTKEEPYKKVAEQFGVDSERIRGIWRQLRREGLVEATAYYFHVESKNNAIQPVVTYTTNGSGDYQIIDKFVDSEVRTLEDLVFACDIDLNEWTVSKWECKKYDSWTKDKNGENIVAPKYSVYAKLEKRVLDKDPSKQKAVLLDEIKEYLSKEFVPVEHKNYEGKGLLLELAAPDLHIGKLSWKEESGEDYDIKIACERYKAAIYDLVSKSPMGSVERILLPVGNDMITIDSRKNMTTAGTPQDSDSRFRKMLLVTRNLLIEVIDYLSQYAPVDVVVISGNHDYDSMFTIGMVLEAFYYTNPNISINNDATQRKYYQFGKNGIMWTHGDSEKHHDLGLIFATEKKQMWADTDYRFCQLGHFHKNKKVIYTSVDEFQGFQVQIIPSLSGTDAWHNSKGYMSLKQAKAFLFDREQGLIGEFTYNIK